MADEKLWEAVVMCLTRLDFAEKTVCVCGVCVCVCVCVCERKQASVG